MPPPSYRPHQRRGSPKFLLVLGVGLALIVAIISTRVFLMPDPIDTDTLCPRGGVHAVHAVLIDRSDPLSPLQATQVRQRLEGIIANAQPGERIDLFMADADGREAPAPVLSLCSPGSEANPIYQNVRKVRERYEDAFRRPIEEAINALLSPSRTDSSPIMESIKSVCVGSFGSLPAGIPVRLTIVSDMLQNSPVMNHFRDREFARFLASPRLASVLADCRSARVHILYVLQPQYRAYQTRPHQVFWENLFDRMNARVAAIDLIS